MDTFFPQFRHFSTVFTFFERRRTSHFLAPHTHVVLLLLLLTPDPLAMDATDEDDACVLRAWRRSCPELQQLWPEEADVRTWEGVTFGDAGSAAGAAAEASGGASAAGAAARIEVIWLSSKGLTGPVPEALGRLTALQQLDLSDNCLTGPVPEALAQLTALTWLQLNDNRLTGPVPAALGGLAALKQLILNNNLLTGAVPAALGVGLLYPIRVEMQLTRLFEAGFSLHKELPRFETKRPFKPAWVD
jgi:hypothetical protein